MRTISQIVEEVLGRSPFYAEALAEGIANHAQIARKIRPEVESRLMEKVSDAAIGMALHRMSKEMRAPLFGMRFLRHLNDITVRSNLVQFVCPNSDELSGILEEISKGSRHRKGSFLNFSRGLNESLLIVDAGSEKGVAGALSKYKNIRRRGKLSAITLRLPEESLDVPGLYYPVLKALAMEGISFVEVMSVLTELSLIFEDADVDRAFSVLKRITS